MSAGRLKQLADALEHSRRRAPLQPLPIPISPVIRVDPPAMPLIPILLLSTVLHVWVGWRIVPALGLAYPWTQPWLLTTLIASALLMPLGFMGRRLNRRATTTVLIWAGLLFMGLFSTLVVLTFMRDAVLALALGAAVVSALVGLDSTWLHPLQIGSAIAVPLLALAASIWGFWAARRTAPVVRVDVPIVGLPPSLHGFSMAQISDMHIGPTIRQAYVQRIVARVNALRADMIAITGDLVDGHVDDLRHHVTPLSGLT